MTRYCRRLSVLISVVTFILFSSVVSSQAVAKARDKAIWNMCGTCHGQDGEGNQAVGAPAVAGLPEWYVQAQLTKFKKGARAAHPRDIIGLRMRPMARSLDDADLTLMAKYVSTMPMANPPETVTGNLVKGENTYKVCVACHQADGKGNQQLGAPPLIGISDWYMVQQLKNFKAGIRGGNPAVDPIGASMQGIATTLADEQAMLDVVAYINTLRPEAPAGH
jgi:cytochrome c553